MLSSGENPKTSFRKYEQPPLANLNTTEETPSPILTLTGRQFISLNSLQETIYLK